jgi:TonB family protein
LKIQCLRAICIFALSFMFPAYASANVAKDDQDIDKRSCEALDDGNRFFAKQEYDLALRLYTQVRYIDQYGKGECTASVYASIATIWLLRGNIERKKDPVLAANYYKRSAFWNRAFANAVACKNGDCSISQSFWDGGGKDIWETEKDIGKAIVGNQSINFNICEQPTKTTAAKNSGAFGNVDIVYNLGIDGKISEVSVLKSSGPTREHKQLDRAALEAARACRGIPNTIDGAEGAKAGRIRYVFNPEPKKEDQSR